MITFNSLFHKLLFSPMSHDSNDECVPVGEKDRVMCFLPLTHVFERGWAFLCLSEGAR